MANVSSFHGTIHFYTDATPWTAEGYLYLFDVLKTIDSSDGSYGFTISDEDITVDSASFLVACLKDGPEPAFPIWGNGRWSASTTLSSFNVWTKTLNRDQTIPLEKYLDNRSKLIELMEANKWFIEIEFTDEEPGSSFIEIGSCIIEGEFNEEHSEFAFNSSLYITKDYPHTLMHYTTYVEEDRRSDMFYEVMVQLYAILQVPPEMYQQFDDFIIGNDLDELLHAYAFYETLDDVPTKIVTGWEAYKKLHATKE